MSRVLRTAALAATAAVVALGLSACDAGTSSSTSSSADASGKGAPSVSAPVSAPASAPAGAAGTGAPGATQEAGAKPDPARTGASSSGAKAAAAGTGRCHTAGLRFSFGNGDQTYSSSDDQQHLEVVMTNSSGSTCTVTGFPGVDLKSADTWSLVRSTKPASTVTLASGASASFVITYLPWEAGSGTEFKAANVVITPPNETTSVTLTWPGDSVLRQDAATHPGTYVGPVTAS